MRSTFTTAVVVISALGLAACGSDETTGLDESRTSGPAFAETGTGGAEEGTYLVRFRRNAIPDDFATRIAGLGGEVIFAHSGVGIAAVAGLDDAKAGRIAAMSGVGGVAADAYTVLEEPTDEAPEASSADPASPANPALAIRFPRQWNLKTIQADVAWAAGKIGSPTVRVGILDTGLDYLHPDLVGRVDLAASRSFLSAAENARVQATFPGAHTIADLNYHGTHVGATVASNAYINAGVTSQVMLVGLKVCAPGVAPSFRGTCPTSGTLAAILHAADIGLPVINMSLGGTFNRRVVSARGGDGPSFLATINQVLNYAHRKGTTIVVSAGNSAADLDHDGNSYKSYCSAPNVICVSATGPTGQTSLTGPWQNIDALASYSNFGRSAISVAAPGGNVISVGAACSGFTVITSLLVCRNRFFISPTNFSAFTVGSSGTSMAAPHVAGVAALLASDGITSPAAIRARIQRGADDLGPAGTDPAYGKGRLNAAKSLGL